MTTNALSIMDLLSKTKENLVDLRKISDAAKHLPVLQALKRPGALGSSHSNSTLQN